MEGVAEISLLHYIERCDWDITLFINSLNTPATDSLWMFMSNKYIWFPMYLVVAVFLFVRLGWKRGLVAVASLALAVTACDQFANLVKDAVARFRPCWTDYMIRNGLHLLEGKGNYYGFFSAHAANSMMFAVGSLICFRIDRKHSYNTYEWCMVIWAVLVGLSRIFVGKHFFGDVLVGLVVGWIIGWIFGKIAEIVSTRLVH